MSLSAVSEAIYDYLEPSASGIENLGAVYRALPKVASEADLFQFTPPGLSVGATMYMFCTDQKEQRIALGGPPPPYGGGGNKFVEYTFAFLVYFKSDYPDTLDGQIAYDAFKDQFCARVRANRTAGTDAAQYGGDGSTRVFQWGEGGINGGVDIQAQHFVPRTIDGGATLFQSLYHINVCETLTT